MSFVCVLESDISLLCPGNADQCISCLFAGDIYHQLANMLLHTSNKVTSFVPTAGGQVLTCFAALCNMGNPLSNYGMVSGITRLSLCIKGQMTL